MSLYEQHVLPHLLHAVCGTKPVQRQRALVVPEAYGRVIEIGMGSGLNLPHYDPDKVELIWGLEPSEAMRRKARRAVAQTTLDIRWLDLPGEEIPLEDNSADTVVLTYTLCTIPDYAQALAEMRRVLKPGGTLLFCEHGEAPDANVRKWQERINPAWRHLAGGCNVNRRISDLIEGNGFGIRRLETGYLPKTPRFAGFNYWGAAATR